MFHKNFYLLYRNVDSDLFNIYSSSNTFEIFSLGFKNLHVILSYMNIFHENFFLGNLFLTFFNLRPILCSGIVSRKFKFMSFSLEDIRYRIVSE